MNTNSNTTITLIALVVCAIVIATVLTVDPLNIIKE